MLITFTKGDIHPRLNCPYRTAYRLSTLIAAKVPLEDLIKVSPRFAAAIALRFNAIGLLADKVIYIKDPLESSQEGKELLKEFLINIL